jgi:PAS domain S-box-containing protein
VHVEAAVESLGDRPLAADSRRDVEALVREAYPSTELLVRDRVVAAARTDVTWYAYRDGRGSARTVEEPWPDDASLPRFVFDASGTYVAANAAVADLVGLSIDEVLGSRIGRFTRHELDPSAGLRAFDVLVREGVLESTAVVVRPDGTELKVDYRITASDDGRYVMTMRPAGSPR